MMTTAPAGIGASVRTPFWPLAVSLIVTSCAPAPALREPPRGEPEAAAAEPEPPAPAAPAPDPLGPRLLAEADHLFTEASRARSAGDPEGAADLYGRAIALYEALAKFDDAAALAVRAENAREARRKASAEAEAAARETWKTEFLAALPAAPFPDDAALLKHFEDAVARNPDDRAARRRLAALYLADERYPEAAATLESDADTEPVLELARAALWYRLGRNDDAVARLEDIRLRWRRALPLRVERPAFCLAPPKGFDQFTPAGSGAFFPRQKLWIYFEVANASVAPVDGGKWKISLRCDYEVVDESGRAVPWPEVRDFARDYDPPLYGTVPDDVCLMLGVVLPGAARGKYTLVLTLTDKIEGKTTEARMPFEIR